MEQSDQDQNDPILLRSVKLTNLLSFGPDTLALELKPLNVLIGPNGAGKSNLIEALALMRATPVHPQTKSSGDIRGVIRRGGGVQEWIWQGAKADPATIELVIDNPSGNEPLRHRFSFVGREQAFKLNEEAIEDETPDNGGSESQFHYRLGFSGQNRRAVINTRSEKNKKLPSEIVNSELSILAQLREPLLYPEITYLAGIYDKWRIYREWTFGRNTIFREPQKADMVNDRLEEDFSNLGLFLSRLKRVPKAAAAILEGLQDLYEGLSGFDSIVEGGTVQVFFSEGDFSIPAVRLSDGTLRYLCLMSILCDPQPPPLVCIEEPELGLHPDIIPKLADHIVGASHRTQLIVTTHSDILIDALSEQPEAVVVCEKHDGKTEMQRVTRQDLIPWMDKYRLGQLWTSGQIGGTRW